MDRETAYRGSRREDIAYCLLGFLGVKMPLLYGESSELFSHLLKKIENHYEVKSS